MMLLEEFFAEAEIKYHHLDEFFADDEEYEQSLQSPVQVEFFKCIPRSCSFDTFTILSREIIFSYSRPVLYMLAESVTENRILSKYLCGVL